MYQILVTILFSLLTTELIKAEDPLQKDWCGTTGKPQSNYTAEQHYEDLKALLKTLKTDAANIGWFEFQKTKSNAQVDKSLSFLERLLTTKSNNYFLNLAMPFIFIMIHREKQLKIPKDKKVMFFSNLSSIDEKRTEELKRLGIKKFDVEVGVLKIQGLDKEIKELAGRLVFLDKIQAFYRTIRP